MMSASLAMAALALGLAMDAFAVSLGQGRGGGANPRHALVIGGAFGAAQGAMPLIGSLLGAAILGWIAAFDHWVVLAVLAFLGLRMIREGLQADGGGARPLAGWALLVAAVATSIDALAAGITLPAMGLPILASAAIIALVTFALCVAGVMFGALLGRRAGQWADCLGGLILIALGLNIFVSHQFLGG